MSSLTEAPVVSEAAPKTREPMTRREQKQAYDNNKLFKRLARQVGEAVTDYNMIVENWQNLSEYTFLMDT